MKLGDILTGKAGGVYEAPTRKVSFKVIGKKAGTDEQVVAQAEAVLAFVPESDRSEARIESERAIKAKFDGAPVPDEALSDERVYYLLARALRDADDPRQPFARNAEEIKRALHRRTVVELYSEYEQFCAEEFPEQIRDEQFEQLLAEAKKKSLADLLSSADSSTIQRALPFLVARLGKSPTETSGG